MQTEDPYWQHCRRQIEARLNWGSGDNWQNADFEVLSERIADQTQVRLSASTLRRLWGRVRYDHLPSVTTLNTLAQFIGYTDWRTFRQYVDQLPAITPPTEPQNAKPQPVRRVNWRQVSQVVSGLFGTGLLIMSGIHYTRQPDQPPAYTFSSRPITRSIPNSVVFTYDASAAPTDSVAIQQSWDPARRQRVARQAHEFTSLYYYPGTYEARLLVGNKVVRKHALLIPTQGWLRLIDRKPVPVYLPASLPGKSTELSVSTETIRANEIALQPDPPAVHFYNVGNFKPVNVNDFSFSCQLKNNYGQGAGICQRTSIALFTETSAISIPLSRSGCIASLTLFAVDTLVSGQSADLSPFGTSFSDWVEVRCEGNTRGLHFYVNDRLAYQLPPPKHPAHIAGMGYGFEGTGAVRQIKLTAGKQLVYQAF